MTQLELRVRVLGHLEVRADGHVVGPPVSASKPRALLGALAVNANRTLSKDALVDRIWEDPPPTARNLVEKYVSAWRKVFDTGGEPGCLETVGPGYRLTLSPDQCDLLAAEQYVAQGRAQTIDGDAASAAAAFDAAVTLWDVGAEDDIEHALALPDSRRLAEFYLATVEEWAFASLTAGTAGQHQLDRLSAALRRHPLRERLAELLMWLLSQQGRQQEAVACYESLRRNLIDDLGQDPSEALQAMHLRVLRQDPALQKHRPRPDRADNLPPRNARFVGRADLLARIDAVFDSSGAADALPAAVAAWGLVGTGKSALALEWAHRRRDSYDCVWWVDAASTGSTAAGLEMLANELGCPLDIEREPSLYRVWNVLRTRPRSLIVFDNAPSAGELAPYLPPRDVADVLITSLNPEWRSLAEPLHVDVLSLADASILLRRRIGAVDAATEAVLLAELGHLPLAMNQAAAYIEQTAMQIEQYIPLFRRRRAQLLQRGVPDDHESTIETTWRLAQAELCVTHPAAVQLLELCALLASQNIPLDLLRVEPGLLTAELRDAVFDELGLEDVIRQVRRYSLISREGDRLHMHCLVQSVVASSLTLDERGRWLNRAARALIALAPDGFDLPETWPQWEAIVPHVREVAQAAPSIQIPPRFAELVQHASHYLFSRAAIGEAVELMQAAQQLIEGTATADDDVTVGRGLTELGSMLEKAGRLKEALVAQQTALVILQRETSPGDQWLARAMGGLTSVLTCHSGVSLWKADELAEAEERFVTALDVLEGALGERHPIIARLIGGLGQVRQDRGDLAGGKTCHERALRITESLFSPDHPDVGHCYDRLGYVQALCGETERSRRCYERSITILSKAYGDNHVFVGWSLSNLAMLLHSTGELDAALDHQSRANKIFVANDDVVAQQISAWRLARIHLTADRGRAAIDLLEPATESLRGQLGEDHADVLAMHADLKTMRQSLKGS